MYILWYSFHRLYDKRENFDFDIVSLLKPLLPKFLGRPIFILNSVRRFRNFIADTVPW